MVYVLQVHWSRKGLVMDQKFSDDYLLFGHFLIDDSFLQMDHGAVALHPLRSSMVGASDSCFTMASNYRSSQWTLEDGVERWHHVEADPVHGLLGCPSMEASNHPYP